VQSTVCAVHDSQVANAWGSSRDLRSTLPFCQCLSLVKDRLEQAVHCFIGFLSPWDLHHFKLHDSSWLSTKVRETYQVRTLPSKDFAETFVEAGERRHWSISPAFRHISSLFHHYFIGIFHVSAAFPSDVSGLACWSRDPWHLRWSCRRRPVTPCARDSLHVTDCRSRNWTKIGILGRWIAINEYK
jgi:hypothetical protein